MKNSQMKRDLYAIDFEREKSSQLLDPLIEKLEQAENKIISGCKRVKIFVKEKSLTDLGDYLYYGGLGIIATGIAIYWIWGPYEAKTTSSIKGIFDIVGVTSTCIGIPSWLAGYTIRKKVGRL